MPVPSTLLARLVSLVLLVASPPRRDERGLSQSTENAVLLIGAVGVATIVITVITAYVKAKLPS